MEARHFLQLWRVECRARGLRAYLAEAWACGSSVRQIASHYALNRPKATKAIDEALDLYADMRGYRKVAPVRQRIAVWEHADNAALRDEAGFRKAEINNRKIRGNS